MNYSGGTFNSKMRSTRECVKNSCHSTEPQSRNLSKQIPYVGGNEPIVVTTQINPSFVKNSSCSLFKAAPRISQQYDSFENSNSSKYGNNINNVQRLEAELKGLETKIEEYASSNKKLNYLLKKTQSKLFNYEKKLQK